MRWFKQKSIRLIYCLIPGLLLLAACSSDRMILNEPKLASPVQGLVTDIAATTPQPSATRTVSPTLSPTSTPTLSPPAGTPTPIVIGTSVAGRPLQVFTFGTGPSKRMIVAGMHGGYEWNTIALADELIQVLTARSELIPGNVTLYILRSLNPDGEARSKSYKGRANENLVDLNRNFPSHWQREWPLDGCWTYTFVIGGSDPASEPETKALMNFLLTHQVEALINYHSAALGIFPGGQPPDGASIRLAEAVAQVSEYPYPPIDTGCTYTGQLIDWASDEKIAAVDIELTNHQETDLWMNLKVIQRFLTWSPR